MDDFAFMELICSGASEEELWKCRVTEQEQRIMDLPYSEDKRRYLLKKLSST